jgi:hypothetical protein
MRETLNERSDSKPETLSNCRRDGNGRRICPSLCARGLRCMNRGVERAQEDRHLTPQAERGSPSRLRGLLRTRGGALGSRRRDLLPGRLTPADLDVNDLPAGRTLYGFAGFPASQNKARPRHKFRQRRIIYTAVPALDKVYRALRYDRRTHFAVNFDREHMVARDLQVKSLTHILTVIRPGRAAGTTFISWAVQPGP